MTVEEDFVAELSNPEGKRGLWVFGPRKSGSTTVVKTIAANNRDALGNTNVKRTAAKLDREIRDQWKFDKLLAANGTDFPLWQEALAHEQRLDVFWEADALWLDDLYPEIDSDFVKRNILMPLDAVLKSRRIVLVSGNVPPAVFGSEWNRAIEAMYMVVPLGEG